MPRTLESIAVELVAELVRRTEERVEGLFADALEAELELGATAEHGHAPTDVASWGANIWVSIQSESAM